MHRRREKCCRATEKTPKCEAPVHVSEDGGASFPPPLGLLCIQLVVGGNKNLFGLILRRSKHSLVSFPLMHRESPSVRESCTGARVLPAGVVCHVPSVSRHFVVSPLPLSNGAKCLNNLSVLSNYHSFPKQAWCLVFSFCAPLWVTAPGIRRMS